MPRVIRPLRPADPVAPIAVKPPTGLGVAGRRMWRQVAPLPWVGATDAEALRSLCQLADQAAALRLEIKARGVSYEARGRW